MNYLAIIVKRNKQFQKSDGKLRTCAVRGDNGLWIPHDKLIDLPTEKDRYNEGVLVMIELGFKDAIVTIGPAVHEVTRALVGFSDDIFKHREDIELWNHALKYQYAELRKREMELDHRETILKMQEGTIEEVHKIMKEKLERENAPKLPTK